MTTHAIEEHTRPDFWFARVDLNVIKDRSLSPCDKAVYAVICAHVDVRTRTISLSVKRIAQETGCAVRTAQKSIQALVKRGVIERAEKFDNGRQLASTYRVIGRDAECYRDKSPHSTEQTHEGGTDSTDVNSAAVVPICASPGANPAHSYLEPRSYENLKNPTPLTPQGGREGGGLADIQNALNEAVLTAYNELLPELPKAERITDSRAKILGRRIRDDPKRAEPNWWRRYFLGVREFPWPMGDNPHNWRADFDWLIGEKGMQKIIEGSFKRTLSALTNAVAEEKHTNEGGEVDGRAVLRELRCSAA
jgi:predicted transcriptional regulator